MISPTPNTPMASVATSMPSVSSRDAEGEARAAGVAVGADEADQQAEHDHRHRLDAPSRAPAPPRRSRPSTISEKYSGAPNDWPTLASGGAKRRDQRGRDAAGEERAERRDRQRRAGAALARHLVAVDAGDDRRGFARQVDQDRGGRAAVLRAVEDAGEHDQAGHRLEMEGERQQHRDGGDRPDAGQHADQRADQGADEARSRDWPASARRRSRWRGCRRIPSPTTPARPGWSAPARR